MKQCFFCTRPVRGTGSDRTKPHGRTKDHLVPRWAGGQGGYNLVSCCQKCNTLKGPLDAATFLRVRHNGKLLYAWRAAVGVELTRRAAQKRTPPYDLAEVLALAAAAVPKWLKKVERQRKRRCLDAAKPLAWAPLSVLWPPSSPTDDEPDRVATPGWPYRARLRKLAA